VNRRPSHTSTTLLVIFVLIFNAVTSNVAFGAADSSLNQVLLCTSSGYKWVNIDELPGSKGKAKQHCALCLFPPNDDNDAQLNALLSSVLIDFNVLGQQDLSNIDAHTLHTRYRHSLAQGRAPPAFYSS